jgi:nitric oxide dioxygenase
VVGAHLQEITQRFYAHLFATHPELLDGTVNRGHQVEGSQQLALAGSVAAFASALVQTPDQLPENLLCRVAHKHASVGVAPDQYQIVHDSLMWAIVDVLGDAVTPQIAAGWDEVYWLMAHTLTHIERGLYSAREVRPNTVWRQWEVEQKIRETDEVVTFVLRRVGDRLVTPSLPGQYVTVQMPLPDGTRQPRQYSLSRADKGEDCQITVKRVHGDGGKGTPDGQVSTRLHIEINGGDVLTLSVQFGAVVLDDAAGRPMVFASAASGSPR